MCVCKCMPGIADMSGLPVDLLAPGSGRDRGKERVEGTKRNAGTTERDRNEKERDVAGSRQSVDGWRVDRWARHEANEAATVAGQGGSLGKRES